VRIALLGPLEITGPAGQVRIRTAKERLVLALLLLRAGEVVPRDALVDALWGDEPPATAVKTLQGHIARVRRALETAGMTEVLATRAPGYVARVPAEAIDVTGFEHLATTGRRALVAGDAARAAADLGKALGLWRGDALADCRGGGWVEPEAVRLDERRLTTVEDRIDADLMLGHDGALVGELESLVARHPLRERLWGSLMLALYRTGRQADAVRAYQRARDVLVGELGLEPGAELRRIEAAVLAGDPVLDVPVPIGCNAALAIPLPARVAATSSRVFVGRAREQAGLEASLHAVTAGERRVVLVSGEPGIGKTSLSTAFARAAFEKGAVVLYGRCDEDLGIPYQPWADVLTHLVDHAPDDLLAAHLDARGSALARLAPDLAGPTMTGPASSSDAESERYLLFGAVVDLLARASALAPVVLVLDDLHWADRPTIQLLRHVVAAAIPLRMVVIGTFRDSDLTDDHPFAAALAALHREPGVERVALRGLGDEELLALLEMTVRHATAEQGVALRDTLLAETDGNPFFVGEILRHLAETRAIYQDEQNRWVTGPDLRASGLPVSIREVIGRRIARLGDDTRGALSLASVIGRDFDVGVLSPVTGLEADTLIDLCDRAVAAAVLTEADVAGWYTFAHALIEHTLYDDLSAGRRGQAHRAVAEALEELCGDDPGARIGELAYHWARATQPADAGKAIAYAQRAGDRALAQLAPDEAMHWYADALALLDQASVPDARRRAELLLGFGDAQRQTGDPEHRETLLESGRLADDIDAIDILVRAALRNNRGWNSIVGGVDHDRIDMLKRALSRLGETDSPDRARLLALLCVEATWDTDFGDRLSMATRAVEIARRTGDDAALVDAIRLCHESITMPETLELRRHWTAEACDLAAGLGDPTASLHANDFRSLDALEAGDLATMRSAYAIFEAESERIGQPMNAWQIAYHGTWLRMLAGDLDAAEASTTAALAFGTEAGFGDDAAELHRGQILCLRWMQGRVHERRERTVRTSDATTPGIQTFLRATRTFSRSFDDRRDEVRQLLDGAFDDDFPMFADTTWLTGHVLWADVAARTRHRAAAELLYERLLPWRGQFATTHPAVYGNVAHYLGLLARALDRHNEADDWFAQALAFHEALEAPFFVASTQTAWAALLADRNGRGDSQRAHALAGAALPAARTRGYGYVERDARAVLERIA
jgi:DNA-binding SARP family transcriptional activator